MAGRQSRPALAAQSAVQNQECHRQTQELRRRHPRVGPVKIGSQLRRTSRTSIFVPLRICVDPPDLRVGPVEIEDWYLSQS